MNLWAFPAKDEPFSTREVIYHDRVLLKSHSLSPDNMTSNWVKVWGHYSTASPCTAATWRQNDGNLWGLSPTEERGVWRVVSYHVLYLAIRCSAMPTEVGITNWQHWGWWFIVSTYREFHVFLIFFFHWLLWFLWILFLKMDLIGLGHVGHIIFVLELQAEDWRRK